MSMLANRVSRLAHYAILPVLMIALIGVTFALRGTAFQKSFPYYHTAILYIALIVLERAFVWRSAVPQRHMIWRDLISTAVETFIAGAIMGAIVLPVLHYFPNAFLGRRFLFGLSDQLGPLWAQVLIVLLLISFFSYWVHRWEHTSAFMWKLHGYHHGVTNLQISNVLVSNPFEWAIRNVMGGLILSIVGFNPIAIVIAGGLNIYGDFSHCGGDLKGGWLNYIFNTPEVHRWHHSTEFPDDPKFRYGCNYGVGVSFWDQLFGTFYLPKDETGAVLAPARLGHPEGYADEPNYIKMLLGVRAFPALERWFDRLSEKKKDGMSSVPAE
jgi:sterol desaturase/sphingolipid hydroxylase (fatty acid hydroxylase superfamily)